MLNPILTTLAAAAGNPATPAERVTAALLAGFLTDPTGLTPQEVADRARVTLRDAWATVADLASFVPVTVLRRVTHRGRELTIRTAAYVPAPSLLGEVLPFVGSDLS